MAELAMEFDTDDTDDDDAYAYPNVPTKQKQKTDKVDGDAPVELGADRTNADDNLQHTGL